MERDLSTTLPSRRRSSNPFIDIPSLASESNRINLFSHAIVALRQFSFKTSKTWTEKTKIAISLFSKTAYIINISNVQQLQTAKTQLHPIDDFFAYISVLHAILAQIEPDSMLTDQLLAEYKTMVDNTDPNWARVVHFRWTGAGRHAVRLAIYNHEPHRILALVPTIQLALTKLSPSSDYLVPLQADFLALSIAAKSYRHAYRWIKLQLRLQVDPFHTGVTASDVHLIYHYSTIICAALQDFQSALHYSKLALSVPAPSPGSFIHVAIATYRYCILLTLLAGKNLSSSLKYSSYIHARMRKATSEYIELANAFEDCNPQEVFQIFQTNRSRYEKHGTLSLVKKVVEDLPKKLLRRLASSYVTMSLEDIARELSLTNAKEAHSMIVEMIKSKSITASIDDKSGIVRISEGDEGGNSNLSTEITNDHMSQCLQIIQKIDKFRERLEQNPSYVIKEIRAQQPRRLPFNGGLNRSSFGMGQVDAEFFR